MSDIQELVESGTETIRALDHARHMRVTAILTLVKTEQGLAHAGALAENRAIVAVGGMKALGANTDARKRALLIALSEDGAYQQVHGLYMQVLGEARLAQATVATLEDTLGLLKASLYASANRE